MTPGIDIAHNVDARSVVLSDDFKFLGALTQHGLGRGYTLHSVFAGPRGIEPDCTQLHIAPIFAVPCNFETPAPAG